MNYTTDNIASTFYCRNDCIYLIRFTLHYWQYFPDRLSYKFNLEKLFNFRNLVTYKIEHNDRIQNHNRMTVAIGGNMIPDCS